MVREQQSHVQLPVSQRKGKRVNWRPWLHQVGKSTSPPLPRPASQQSLGAQLGSCPLLFRCSVALLHFDNIYSFLKPHEPTSLCWVPAIHWDRPDWVGAAEPCLWAGWLIVLGSYLHKWSTQCTRLQLYNQSWYLVVLAPTTQNCLDCHWSC